MNRVQSMNAGSRQRSRTGVRLAWARGVAALLATITIFGGRSVAAPADVFSSPTPVIGSDPPKAAELKTGDASVSTQTGQLSYGYPIQVPPGRGGMVPHLALNYSSQAPIYGGLASGWSLSIPAILEDTSMGRLRTRSPEVETQQGVATAPDDDRFLSTMAGNRPLIKVTEPASAGVGWTYRAQNDSSYTRYQKMNGGSFPWRAYTSAGTVLTFGEAQRMGSCQNVGPGYAPLTSETDSFGNEVSYTYSIVAQPGECLIQQITWGTNIPAGIVQPFAKVEFTWTPSASYTGFAVGAKTDYRTGTPMSSGGSRLNTITVTAFAPGAEQTPDHTRVITLGYDATAEAMDSTIQHSPLKLLTSIQESAWIGANQYRVDLPAVTFDYESARVRLTPAISSLTPPWSVAAHPTPHRNNLGWGYRHDDRWPTVEQMMVDLDGDGLLDRLTNTSGASSFASCTANWQRNLGPDSSSQVQFGALRPISLPRLKWGSPTVGIAGSAAQRGAPYHEGCSLNGQVTTYQNSQTSAPDTCHDSQACKASADPNKPNQKFCYPGGTTCPDREEAASGTGPYPTYLAYRWIDADGDGITDLVTAIHGNINRYDIGRGNSLGLPDGGIEPLPLGITAWPACPEAKEVQQCRDLGAALSKARICPQGFSNSVGSFSRLCSYDWKLVNTALTSADAVACSRIMARVPPGGGGGSSASQAPYMRCEGLYPWFIYKGQANGGFPASPIVKYQPVPLESDQGDSALSGPSLASQHHGVMDIDGDGRLDGVVHGKELGAGNPDGWYVWLGDGTGGIGPKRYFFPTRPVGGPLDNNRISASVGQPGDGLGTFMGTTDLNADGLPDHWIVDAANGGTNIAMNGGTSFMVVAPNASGGINTPDQVRPTSETTTYGVVKDSGVIVSGHAAATNRLLDVDNDGRPDIVVWGRGLPRVYYNLGGQFLAPSAPFQGDATSARRQLEASQVADPDETLIWELTSDLMDLDGDGIAEGVAVSSQAFGRSVPGLGAPRLMTAVHNGRGLHSFVSYASMHEASATPTVTQTPTATWWDGAPKATPRQQWVVSSIRVEDDFDAFPNGTGTTTNYQYANPRHGPDDVGYFAFRGFETVTTTSQTGARTIQTYDYRVDWSGRLAKTVVSSAESPGNAVSVDQAVYQPFSLFGGALTTFHAIENVHYTCADNQTEAACTASATAPAAYTRTISSLKAKSSDTTPDVPLMYVESSVRSQHGFAAADGDRSAARTYWLAADSSMYLLRPLTELKQSQVAGAMVTYAQSATTWDPAAPAYARKLTDEVWVDAVDANRSVTTYHYEPQTGNLLSTTSPRGNTTSYEYDARKLFVSSVNSPLYNHDLELEYEYGTGTKTITRGPNIAWCQQTGTQPCPPGAMVRDANKVVIDGIGRPLERWESVNVDPNHAAYFDLRKVETTSYVDSLVGASPTSTTHQAALKEVAGITSFTQAKTELDGHGRPTKTIQFALGAAPADHVTSHVYRLDGTLQSASLPDPSVNSAATVTYTYTFDSLGRPTTMRRPGNTTGVDLSYQAAADVGVSTTATEVTGASGNAAVTKRTMDRDGRLARVDEKSNPSGAGSPATWATTLYEYNANDTAKKITDPEGKITLLFHDQAGHRTRVERNGQQWDYAYDQDGNVTSELTPCSPQPVCRAAFVTRIAYDALGRVVRKDLAPRTMSAPDLALFGAAQETFAWDYGSNARGRLSRWEAWAPGSIQTQSQQFNYDPQGRSLFDYATFTSAGFSQARYVGHTYFLGGQPQRTAYYDRANGGSNSTVADVSYDARGLPSSLAISTDSGLTFQPSIVETRNVAGLVTNRRVDYPASPTPPMSYAESVWTYDNLGRVLAQVVNKGPGTTQVAKQALTYLGNDDVGTLTTYFGTTAKQQTFTFDYRHQLTGVASSPSTYFGAAYQFGPAGRFTRATVTQTISPRPSGTEVKPRSVNYNYAGPDPEQVTSLTNVSGGATLEAYTYDLSGNQLTRTEPATGLSWSYLYDGKDQLRRATKKLNGTSVGSEEYWYDSNGQRTQVVNRDAANAVTELVWFSGDTEAHYNPAGTVLHAYANISLGTPVARTDRTNDTTMSTEYQFHGLANSTLAAVSSTGTINASFNYAPFGEVLESTNAGGATSGTAAHKRRFNDKQQDDISGLTYYGARYYDKLLMNWTQSDPLYLRVPDLAKQSTPRRSNIGIFSLNNPIRYLDADGLDPEFWTRNSDQGRFDAAMEKQNKGAIYGGVEGPKAADVGAAAAMQAGLNAYAAARKKERELEAWREAFMASVKRSVDKFADDIGASIAVCATFMPGAHIGFERPAIEINGGRFIYRTGSQTDGALTDPTGVSFRDSFSSAMNGKQTFRPGEKVFAVDTTLLPQGSFAPDGTTAPGGPPPGHVSVRASPDQIRAAIVPRGPSNPLENFGRGAAQESVLRAAQDGSSYKLPK